MESNQWRADFVLRVTGEAGRMNRITQFCTRVKVVVVEVASTVVFLVFLYVVVRYEITQLLR